jgi:DNA polymerase-1
MKLTEEFATKNGFGETIFGRKCFVPLIKSNNKNLVNFAKRQAINAPIQGSNADIIKLAMVKINENKNIKGNILLQIHDELVIEVQDNYVDETLKNIKDTMENIIQLEGPLIVDTKIDNHL